MSLYKEELLEHYKEPQNFGELPKADIIINDHNTSCGDHQEWMIQLTTNDRQQKISDVRFKGDGCVVSTAAASLLSEAIKGKSLEEIKQMTQQDMEELLGTKVSPARINCLLFPLKMIHKGIAEK